MTPTPPDDDESTKDPAWDTFSAVRLVLLVYVLAVICYLVSLA